MSNVRVIYLIPTILVSIISCTFQRGPEGLPVASVDNHFLYLSELRSSIPDGLSKEESLLVAEDYIRRWINKELLVKKAQDNLSVPQKELAREMEEYRNSLIIYRYQRELMFQKLDTCVSESEISNFYDSVREDFRQNVDLIKAVTVKIPRRTYKPERVKAFCEGSLQQSLGELEVFCKKYNGVYTFFLDQWVEPEQVFRDIPYHPKSIPGFLRQFTTWETRDTGFYYLVSIQDYSPAGGFAPVDYVGDNIKEMILNKRKADFLRKLEDDVYMEGLRNYKFKIYAYETNE